MGFSNPVLEFFWTARERETIRRKKEAGEPWPWTEDQTFQKWFFCNVHRENDKTTIWFAKNVRDHVSDYRAVEATFIMRWFNRISTCEIIKDLMLKGWKGENARYRLEYVKPIVTGAYMLKTPDGMDKGDGVIHAINEGIPILKRIYREWDKTTTLEQAWKDLKQLPYVGPFMSYEIVTDLRHTNVLGEATDILTWANPGPGCTRGLRTLYNVHYNRHNVDDLKEMHKKMKWLLKLSRKEHLWPRRFQGWEMREVEHWLCEYSKYTKGKDGYRLKRKHYGEKNTISS